MSHPATSPWTDSPSQDSWEEIASGIWQVSTPSHGGVWVSPERISEIPDALRTNQGYPAGWYEEDIGIAIPLYYFADAFALRYSGKSADDVRQMAKKVMEEWPEDFQGFTATSKRSTMNFAQREAALLVEMSRAPQAEQRRLVAELDALRAQHAASIQADRDLDLASATVAERMTPVLAYSHHTSDTDWLVEVPTSAPSREVTTRMVAEATQWYRRLHEAIKAEPEELAEQAKGMARRAAGRYGEQADLAAGAFYDAVVNLVAADTGAPRAKIAKTLGFTASTAADGGNCPSCNASLRSGEFCDACGLNAQGEHAFTCSECGGTVGHGHKPGCSQKVGSTKTADGSADETKQVLPGPNPDNPAYSKAPWHFNPEWIKDHPDEVIEEKTSAAGAGWDRLVQHDLNSPHCVDCGQRLVNTERGLEDAYAGSDSTRCSRSADGLHHAASLKVAKDGDFHVGRVKGASSLEQVQSYLPSNYTAHQVEDGTIYVQGYDQAGWTWDDYVKPRFLSGLMGIEDVSSEGQGQTWASKRTAAENPFAPCPSCSGSVTQHDPGCVASGPKSGVPEGLFPGGGVPLEGDLTPEQEAWLKSRASRRTAADSRHISQVCYQTAKALGSLQAIYDAAADPAAALHDDAKATLQAMDYDSKGISNGYGCIAAVQAALAGKPYAVTVDGPLETAYYSSRRIAEQAGETTVDHEQSGQGVSSLPDVSPSAPEAPDPINPGPDAPVGTGAADVASVPTPGASVADYPTPPGDTHEAALRFRQANFRATVQANIRQAAVDPYAATVPFVKSDPSGYKSRAAQDAATSGYGGPDYAAYLDRHSQEMHDYFMAKGDEERANEMMTRTLAEALRGNDGD